MSNNVSYCNNGCQDNNFWIWIVVIIIVIALWGNGNNSIFGNGCC